MAAASGRDLVISINTGGGYVAIAGVSAKSVSKSNEPVDVTDDDANGWRTVLAEPGLRTVDLDVSGVTKDDILITQMSAATDSILLQDCKISYAGGAEETGDFYLSNCTITGESAGAVTFSAALSNSSTSDFNITQWDQAQTTNYTITGGNVLTGTGFDNYSSASTVFSSHIKSNFTLNGATVGGDNQVALYGSALTSGIALKYTEFTTWLFDLATGNESDFSTIPALVNGDIVTIESRSSGIYITINGDANSWAWDGVSASVPTKTGVPSSDTGESGPAISGEKNYVADVVWDGVFSYGVSADFNA